MILFQTQIEEHRALAEHYRELAANREAKAAELAALEQQVMGAVQTLLDIKEKLDADAIATLQSAVMGLLSDGGNQPQPPAPEPEDSEEDSEFEIFGLNGESGECLTSDDLSEAENQDFDESSLSISDSTKYPETLNTGDRFWFGSPDNTGTVVEALKNDEYLCQIDGAIGEVELSRPSLHFISAFLEGQSCDIDAAPRTGQCCQWASPFASPFACPVEFAPSPEPAKRPNRVQPAFGLNSGGVDNSESETEKPAFTEFVDVSDRVGYLKLKDSGEIKAVYAGFSQKQRAESWGKWLAVRHSIATGFEVRAAKHLPFKWELKLWGLNINQINRLASENLAVSPHTEVDSTKPPSYKKPQPLQPVNPDDVEPGDIVTPLLSPGDSYEVIQIMPNGILDCQELTTGDRKGLRPGAVSLVEKAKKPSQLALDVDSKPDTSTKYVRVKVKMDDFYGQVFPVVKETEQGATLLTHLGNRWFRADCLEFIDPDAPVLVAVGAGADDGWDF